MAVGFTICTAMWMGCSSKRLWKVQHDQYSTGSCHTSCTFVTFSLCFKNWLRHWNYWKKILNLFLLFSCDDVFSVTIFFHLPNWAVSQFWLHSSWWLRLVIEYRVGWKIIWKNWNLKVCLHVTFLLPTLLDVFLLLSSE